jgi:hypothetical protein
MTYRYWNTAKQNETVEAVQNPSIYDSSIVFKLPVIGLPSDTTGKQNITTASAFPTAVNYCPVPATAGSCPLFTVI